MYKIGLVLTIALLLFAGVGVFPYAHAASPSAVNLGTAGGFAILSKSGITDVPASAISGNIGTSPITGASITGLTCAEVTGIIYTVDAAGPPCRVIDPARLTTAVGDMMTAYTDAAGRACGTSEGVTNLNGQTITTGVYCWTGTLAVTGSFTISGSSSDVFIFQVPGTLTVSNGVVVTLIGGATPSNVFWQVGGATTIGTTVSFQGVILDATNIAMQSGASLTGRALAQTAVTLIMNTVNAPSAVNPPPATTNTTVKCSPSSVTVGSSSTCTATVTSTGSAPLTGTLAFTSSDPSGTFTNVKCGTNDKPGGDRTGDEGGSDGNGNGNGNVLRCTADYTPSSTGTQTITATYSGDPNNASSAGTFVLTVTLAATHTSLTCDLSKAQAGKSTKCEAQVTARDHITPTGSVTFTSSDTHGTFGQVTCTTKESHQDATAQDKGEGQTSALTCLVDYTPSSTGTQTITATYSGDASHSPSSATFNLNGGEDGGDQPVPGALSSSIVSPLS